MDKGRPYELKNTARRVRGRKDINRVIWASRGCRVLMPMAAQVHIQLYTSGGWVATQSHHISLTHTLFRLPCRCKFCTPIVHTTHHIPTQSPLYGMSQCSRRPIECMSSRPLRWKKKVFLSFDFFLPTISKHV